jgi:hypothetical protein
MFLYLAQLLDNLVVLASSAAPPEHVGSLPQVAQLLIGQYAIARPVILGLPRNEGHRVRDELEDHAITRERRRVEVLAFQLSVTAIASRPTTRAASLS